MAQQSCQLSRIDRERHNLPFSHADKNCEAKRTLTEKVTFDMEQIHSSQILLILLQNSNNEYRFGAFKCDR